MVNWLLGHTRLAVRIGATIHRRLQAWYENGGWRHKQLGDSHRRLWTLKIDCLGGVNIINKTTLARIDATDPPTHPSSHLRKNGKPINCSATLLTYCLLAGSIGHRSRNATVFVRGHLLHFSPGVSHLLRSLFRVSLSGVSWPTSSPLPWGVPCDGLTGDGIWWFPECMSYPPPFSLLYFIFYG